MRKARVALACVAACLLWLVAPGSVGIAAAAAVNYQGLWWNASESGWGINFAHQGDTIFATWFTFDASSKPWWLIAELHKTGEGIYSGNVSTLMGPPFNSVPFPREGSPGGALETVVGTMTATFADASHATIDYKVDGSSQTKSIVPIEFGGRPVCTWGEQADLALATNYQDLWWNSAESGWGVNFTHQGDIIFATWFTYDAGGKPWWLIAELHKDPSGAYAGGVSTVNGPAFNAVPFPREGSPGGAVETPIGTATVTFTDGNHASFAYTINGASQTKAITRIVFAPPGTLCNAPSTVDPARKDAARFLRQATFGAPREAIDALVAQGYDAWLADQFAKPMVSHVESFKAIGPSLWGSMAYNDAITHELMQHYFEGEDQLRQRVADALLQIFVISFTSAPTTYDPCGTPAFLDVLNRGAFGNFRDLLRDVTLSPMMGEYLSMKQSAKADPVGKTQPDENYAREVMQLFTVGLVMLNDDGTPKLGADGKPMPTFNEDTVKGFANALSGWTLDVDQSRSWMWNQTSYYTDPDPATSVQLYCDAWSKPMAPWLAPYLSWDRQRTIPGPAHDQGAKQLMVYPGAPYSTLPAGQSPQADLENTLDNLFHHPNVGPFIGRQLIQRLVTSNPSPGYVARVAARFNDNGSGVRGDMKAVVRAILLDDEARNLALAAQPTFGKLTEPFIRFVQYFRAFKSTATGYNFNHQLIKADDLSQAPLFAPSVFNFYPPNYVPAGPLTDAGLVGPEFGITNATSLAGFSGFSSCFIPGLHIPGWGKCFGNTSTSIVYVDLTYYAGLADSPAQLVDELELVLCAACLDPTAKGQIVQAVGRVTTGNTFWGFDLAHERVHVANWLILNSPDYSVQK
jgi:uncharacterized protein (DUF1800 family)